MGLERTAERVPLEAGPELFRSRPRPILVDTWQNVPEVWDVVRHAVDRDPSGSQFLLAGVQCPGPVQPLTRAQVESAGFACAL